jgi:hypothetical protein
MSADEQSVLDAALAASLRESRHGSRLNTPPPGTPSPPAYNRIAEYEKCSTPPVRKREGPAFEVIKTTRSPSDTRSPIQELPNGESWAREYSSWTEPSGIRRTTQDQLIYSAIREIIISRFLGDCRGSLYSDPLCPVTVCG